MTRDSVRRGWIVRLLTQAPEGEPEAPPGDQRLARLVDLLEGPYAGRAAAYGSAVDIRLEIDDPAVRTADEAAFAARKIVLEALREIGGFDGWEISPGDPVPELVGTQEVTRLLSVSRQRLHELRQDGRFPLPALELAGGALWIRADVEAFAAGWDRRPGRPSTVASCPGSDAGRGDRRRG